MEEGEKSETAEPSLCGACLKRALMEDEACGIGRKFRGQPDTSASFETRTQLRSIVGAYDGSRNALEASMNQKSPLAARELPSPTHVHSPLANAGLLNIRLWKTFMVLSVGVWGVLVASGNLLDYDSNWQFVRHVLSMDTVFPDNKLRYRAITDPTIQAAGYWLIIATEWLMGLTCLAGAWRLFRTRKDAQAFVAAKPLAAAGLVLVFLLYYLGFVVIGGEWFSMWQSSIWNGQGKAAIFAGCAVAVLLVLLQREEQ